MMAFYPSERRLIGSSVGWRQGSACSCYSSSIAVFPHQPLDYRDVRIGIDLGPIKVEIVDEKDKRRKEYKAECKAQQMLADIIGFDQWKVYRKTNLVAVKGKAVWLIGDFYKRYDKFRPFHDKPDVIRVDRPKIWQQFLGIRAVPATSFCVETRTGESYPYTDKVLTFVIQCAHEEKKFYRMANRIEELMIKKMPLCAMYDGE